MTVELAVLPAGQLSCSGVTKAVMAASMEHGTAKCTAWESLKK
jgi:hypothetical protein